MTITELVRSGVKKISKPEWDPRDHLILDVSDNLRYGPWAELVCPMEPTIGRKVFVLADTANDWLEWDEPTS
jgi:hypothetical protein